MTFAAVSVDRGTATSKASSTTVAGAPSGTITAGNLAICVVVADNLAGSDGDSTQLSVSDSAGNTWARAKEAMNDSGAAAGVIAAIFYSILDTTLTTGSTVTVTSTGAIVAKAFGLAEFTVTSGEVAVADAGHQIADIASTYSVTVSGLASEEHLWIGLNGMETDSGNANPIDTGYTALTFAGLGHFGTAGGTATTNVGGRAGYLIETGTTQTYSANSGAAGRDRSTILVAFREAGPATFERAVALDAVGAIATVPERELQRSVGIGATAAISVSGVTTLITRAVAFDASAAVVVSGQVERSFARSVAFGAVADIRAIGEGGELPEEPPPSGVPVLIRAAGRLGRVFHEISSRSGDTYHPAISAWQATEEAPGGFGPATGRIPERIYKAHRDIFTQGAEWRTFLEADGTCIHGGRLLEPDASGGEVQLADRGRASLAEREMHRVLYQARDIGMLAHFSGSTERWSVNTASFSISNDPGAVIFSRLADSAFTGDDSGPVMSIPLWGCDLTRLAFNVAISGNPGFRSAFIDIFVTRGFTNLDEVDLEQPYEEVWYANLGSATGTDFIEVDIDLTLTSTGLPFPNDLGTNEGNPSHIYPNPDLVMIHVGEDEQPYTVFQEVSLSKIRINGAAIGDNFSASDLVGDLSGRMGLRASNIESSGVNILPYDLPEGSRLADGLDYAALMTGWRWLIRDTGCNAYMDFGPYSRATWTVASPWSPLDPIPMERYNRVRVPFLFADGQSTDHVLVKADPDPLEYRNEYGRLALDSPAHNQENARNLGLKVLEKLVKPRWGGTGSFVELVGEDGVSRSAHHLFAGDTVDGRQRGEAERLLVGSLTRTEETVQVTFDGELRALDRQLARRERRQSLRRRHRS